MITPYRDAENKAAENLNNNSLRIIEQINNSIAAAVKNGYVGSINVSPVFDKLDPNLRNLIKEKLNDAGWALRHETGDQRDPYSDWYIEKKK